MPAKLDTEGRSFPVELWFLFVDVKGQCDCVCSCIVWFTEKITSTDKGFERKTVRASCYLLRLLLAMQGLCSSCSVNSKG
jgi:hypothetical protein